MKSIALMKAIYLSLLVLTLAASTAHAQRGTARKGIDILSPRYLKGRGMKGSSGSRYGGIAQYSYAEGECEICSKENKIRPGLLTMKYIGGPGAISKYQDADKATCRDQNFPMDTVVSAYGVTYPVKNGEIFTIGQADVKMDAETDFTFSGSSIECYIHTSCSQPLVAGDRIGPFLLLEGNDCSVPSCGDGLLDPDETCEPVGTIMEGTGAVCRDDCTYCGDGLLNGDEECDEGRDMPSKTCDNCKVPDCVCEARGSYDVTTRSVTLEFDFCGEAEPDEDDFIAIYPCETTDLIVIDQRWFDEICSTQLQSKPNCDQFLRSLGYELGKVYPAQSGTWMAFTCGSPGDGSDCQNKNNPNAVWPSSNVLTIDPDRYWDARWAFPFTGPTLDTGCYKTIINRDISQAFSAPPYPSVCKDWYEAPFFIVSDP